MSEQLLKVGKDMFGMAHAYDEGGDRLSNNRPAFPLDEWEAKMRRLVACWNACAGIDTGQLEQAAANFDLIAMRKAEARADEAERLLEGLSKRHEWQPDMGRCVCEWHEAARVFLNARESK